MSDQGGAPDRRARFQCVLLLALSTLILILLGFGYYLVEREKIFQENHQALATVSRLTANQLQQWRRERSREAERAAKSRRLLDLLMDRSQTSNPGEELRKQLMLEMRREEHVNLLLFDRSLRLLASAVEVTEPVPAATERVVQAAFSGTGAVISDFFLSPEGEVRIGVASAVRDPGGKPLAVLIQRSRVDASLYPLVQHLPARQDVETHLVERNGSSALCLNELQGQKPPFSSRSIPWTARDCPAVQVVLGRTGAFEGREDGGREMLRNLQKIPDSSWFLVSEMNMDEVVAEVRQRAGTISLIVGVFVLLVAVLLVFFFRYRQARLDRDLLRAEKAKSAAQETYRRLFESMLDGFVLFEAIPEAGGAPKDFRFLTANPAFEIVTGRPTGDVIGRTIREAFPKVESKWIELFGRIVQTGVGEEAVEYSRSLRRYLKLKAFCPEPGKVAMVFDDITEQRILESRMRQLSSLHTALGYCNQAIVHSSNAETLLPKVCQAVVQHGGMKMAWVGMLDEATRLVRPVVAYGDDIGCLENIEISTDPEVPAGRGPTGTAIREDRPVWCHDFQSDPDRGPWQGEGVTHGWKSGMVIPLRRAGKVVGTLNLYSGESAVFGEDVRKLSIEMAGEVSFALDSYAREAELQMLRVAVEQSANTIVITDLSGNIEYVNPAFERISGYQAAEVIGKNPRVLKSGKQSDSLYQSLWRTITSGNIWKGRFQNRRKDGSLYWEAAVISPIHNEKGEVVRFVAVKEDITTRKSLEEDLRTALERAEASSRAKGEFLAVMSHELRTPLNGVLGYAELLSYSQLDAEQKECVETIRESGNHLLQVVNDILDFSSIEKGAMKFEFAPIHVAALVDASCLPIRKTMADKGLTFHCALAPEVPEQICGDAYRIQQILINLLGNAVKFTSQGEVSLRVDMAVEGKQPFVVFSVRDTGIGMSSETMNRLFQPFMQGDATLRRLYAGTGLGLAISQRITRAMNGSIHVTSELGKGSTFSVRIPLNAPLPGLEKPPEPPTDESHAGETTPRTCRPVLVVEDEPGNSVLAGKMLEALGWKAEFSADGLQAVKAFVPGKYAAILMDVEMPSLNGLEAAERIRHLEQGTGSHVLIIALTANVMPGDRDRCLAAGMDVFLAKPFKKAELAACLETGAV